MSNLHWDPFRERWCPYEDIVSRTSLAFGERQDLSRLGYAVLKNAVNPAALLRAKRLIMLEIVNWGLPVEQINEWHQNKTWFPTLRETTEIKRLANFVPPEAHSTRENPAQLCEPQILLHLPDEAEEWEFEYHVDEEPPWAEGRKYVLIAGVALTDNNLGNGGLMAKHSFDEGADPIELSAGDIVLFHPDLPHRGGLNRSGDIRMMVYLRWLERKNAA